MFFGTRADFNGPYFWSLGHLIFIAVGTIAIALICYFGRHISKEKFRLCLLLNGIFIFMIDIGIIIWQVTANGFFDLYEDLPIHLCAVMKFVFIALYFVKNDKVKRALYPFLFALGTIGGLANFFLPGVLEYYPVWAFRTLASLTTHWTMVLYGVWSYVSGFYRPEPKDILYGMIPLTLLSALCIPLNYAYGWDYMFYAGKYQVFNLVASAVPDVVYIMILYSLYVLVLVAFIIPVWLINKHRKFD